MNLMAYTLPSFDEMEKIRESRARLFAYYGARPASLPDRNRAAEREMLDLRYAVAADVRRLGISRDALAAAGVEIGNPYTTYGPGVDRRGRRERTAHYLVVRDGRLLGSVSGRARRVSAYLPLANGRGTRSQPAADFETVTEAAAWLAAKAQASSSW